MFWGAVGYDYKGPCHIWEKESSTEKHENDIEITALKVAAEPAAREAWVQEQIQKDVALAAMGKQRQGKKPTFKFTAFLRNGKAGGIDWFRYRKHILIDKLFPA